MIPHRTLLACLTSPYPQVFVKPDVTPAVLYISLQTQCCEQVDSRRLKAVTGDCLKKVFAAGKGFVNLGRSALFLGVIIIFLRTELGSGGPKVC